MSEKTHIRLFQPSDAQAFHDLNIAWIKQHFDVSDKDRRLLENPEREIIAQGGRVIIAERDGQPIGSAALIPKNDDLVELAKMCLDENCRGFGVGQAILERADQEALNMGARRIWLESHSALHAALRLYARAGYQELSTDDFAPTPSTPCNKQMIKTL